MADDPRLEAPLPQPRVDAIAQLVAEKGIETVLFGQSILAADIAAGLAARLDAGLNWQLTDISSDGGELVGKQSALGDSVVVDVGWTTTPRIGLFRAGAFDPTEQAAAGTVETFKPELQQHSLAAEMVEQAHAEESPSIEDANVIVAGGRGLGEPEKFALVEELAKALGGAVAAARRCRRRLVPVFGAGRPDRQVVSPTLYIACGISGAIQHKVGMQSSKTIVAINKDPNAPIFEFADLGVVGDLHAIVPKLTELVRARKDEQGRRPPGGLPAAVLPVRGDRAADRSGGRADRGRRPHRRRRAGRARLRDPARAAARGVARDGRAARRGAGRRGREGKGPARTSSPAPS